MPRKPRMYVANVPCHIIVRGNNREVCFFTEADYLFYLNCLKNACAKYHVAVHAYVLMTNHMHLLMTPQESTGVSLVMQSIGRCYVQHVNKRYRRCGTLFESRHKASLVQSESYLLTLYRYIELNPVRAGMVTHPGDYKWSSYATNAYGAFSKVLVQHEIYKQLGDDNTRLHNYRELFNIEIVKSELHKIRKASQFSMPLGNDRFKIQIEQALGRRIGYMQRGRPRRPSK